MIQCNLDEKVMQTNLVYYAGGTPTNLADEEGDGSDTEDVGAGDSGFTVK